MKKKFYNLLILIFFIFNISCSQKVDKISTIQENNLELQVLEAYKEGMQSLKDGDVLFAAKKFNEVELIFPQSIWAPKSVLMAAYSYYSQDYYELSIAELERFILIYPNHKNMDYAYYLLALSYYEKIVDETKDLKSIIKAKENFDILINKFPESNYISDANFKLDLIEDIIASKEMYLGRYYFYKKKWIPAINRFRVVVDSYNTTIYIEEALYRLVEIYYILGLKEESLKYAKLLGYNYGSSMWYKNSYKLFNENYKEITQNETKENKTIIKKFKSLFE